MEAGGQIPLELSKNWTPGSQNQSESSRITDVSSRIIDEFEAWGSEWDLQKSFKKAVGSLGTGFGHFPVGNRSPYGHSGVACQNLKNPRHRGIGCSDARIGGPGGHNPQELSIKWTPGSQNPRELSMNLEAGGQILRELSKNWKNYR